MRFNKMRCMALVCCLLSASNGKAQEKSNGIIEGTLDLDHSWSREIYLSHIPTLDDLYTMSNEMVISRTEIDSLGYFSFDLSFLPGKDNLYRLHLVKSGDSKYSLTIGGRDENHMFLIANRYSEINFRNDSYPPFRRVEYSNSQLNQTFQQIAEMVFYNDSLASESGLTKRKFIKSQEREELMMIADTSLHPLISLYALHHIDPNSILNENPSFITQFLEKWKDQKSSYFNALRISAQYKEPSDSYTLHVLSAFFLIAIGFLFGKYGVKRKDLTKNLSVQERKIYDLLKTGASN